MHDKKKKLWMDFRPQTTIGAGQTQQSDQTMHNTLRKITNDLKSQVHCFSKSYLEESDCKG